MPNSSYSTNRENTLKRNTELGHITVTHNVCKKSAFPVIKATFIQEVKITAVIFLMKNSGISFILFPGSCLFPIKVQGLECDFVSVAKLGLQCLCCSFLL